MKKILYAAAAGIGMYQTSVGMQTVSYHLFSGSPILPVVDIAPEVKTKLYSDLSTYNECFQQAPCTRLEIVAGSLINDYKKIFVAGDDDALEKIFEQEKEVFSNIETLSKATDAIVQLRTGLPDAALRLESMYETIGIYNLALLWALVAYKLGYKQAKADASRLLLIIGK